MNRIKNRLRKGFTLIELMIVVAIIGILAAIAIPNFIRYQLRSKTAESKTVIGGIKTSEESFRAEFDGYVTAVNGNAGFASTKAPWVVIPCAGCSRLTLAGCVSYDCIGYKPTGEVYYNYNTLATAPGALIPQFGTTAEGDLDGDTNHGEFAFCSSNAVGQTNCAPAPVGGNCLSGWATVPPSEVYDCAPNIY